MPTWLRSVLSVLLGFIVFYALQGTCTIVASRLFNRNFDQPTTGYLLATVIYTLTAALIGGYVAARVAPRSPLLHGIGVAVLMLLLGALNINKGFGGQETLYVLVRSIGAPLCAILGAALDHSRHSKLLR